MTILKLRRKVHDIDAKGQYFPFIVNQYTASIGVKESLMSRAIVRIFDPTMVTSHEKGVSSDDIDAPEITRDLIENFKNRLPANDYEYVENKDGVDEYRHTGSSSWSLRVLISKNEISFTCPPAQMFITNLLYEALRTASELCDHDKLAIYHCHGRGWINSEHLFK